MHHFPFPLEARAGTNGEGARIAVGALHGDISPENILFMQDTAQPANPPESPSESSPSPLGTLIFSDFGLSTLLHTESVTEELTLFRGTRTFEAPEDRLGLNVRRASDVWSFGGVVLEFLVRLVVGRKVLDSFFEERCTPIAGSGGRIRSHFFYELVVDENGEVVDVEVKEVVKKYIKRIREDLRCEQAVKQALDVVEGMLVVDSHRRFTAQSVAHRFGDIVKDMGR